MKGYIKLGKPTAGHKATLEKLGYEVQEVDGHLEVEVEGFVSDLDLSGENSKEVLQDLINSRKAITYSTRALVQAKDEDGDDTVKPLFSFALARKLGPLSCIMMKSKKGSAKKQADSLFDLGDFIS